MFCIICCCFECGRLFSSFRTGIMHRTFDAAAGGKVTILGGSQRKRSDRYYNDPELKFDFTIFKNRMVL